MDPYNSADAHNVSANPYAAPQAGVAELPPGDTQEKAGRGARLAAVLLDGVPPMVLMIVCIPILVLGDGFTKGSGFNVLGGTVIGIAALALLGYVIYQLVLLHRNGQTFGKKLMKIKIVRKDGSRAGLGRIFWLRMFVPGLAGNIPFIGVLFALADPLFIFGEEKRCVHDLIADTIVINA
ncbi:RDD family protein [Thermomonas sp.]|uniref:RDD family protein n=1 Tax=Thermomonas sp. TaxID=1971895 RepID=UPI0035B3C9C3